MDLIPIRERRVISIIASLWWSKHQLTASCITLVGMLFITDFHNLMVHRSASIRECLLQHYSSLTVVPPKRLHSRLLKISDCIVGCTSTIILYFYWLMNCPTWSAVSAVLGRWLFSTMRLYGDEDEYFDWLSYSYFCRKIQLIKAEITK